MGLGDITGRSSPVQVGLLTNWSLVATGPLNSLAIKTDGTLWSWGDNTYGQLGDGTVTHRSSPVQIGALTTWSKVSVGAANIPVHVLAVKTDGTLWAWGGNSSGQLGQRDLVHRSSPVQVGTSTNWSSVATIGDASLGIKNGPF